MGLDPGFRTGVKVAVVAGTGKVTATATIYPHEPQRRWEEAIASLAKLAREHKVELVAIGNGTASRETDRLAAELMQQHAELSLTKVVVSEAGASVYSAPRMRLRNCPTSMSRCAVRSWPWWRRWRRSFCRRQALSVAAIPVGLSGGGGERDKHHTHDPATKS